LECSKSLHVEFGRAGRARVGRGYYVYTGSALGKGAVSLEGRIARHTSVLKRVHWHVDYLTSSTGCITKGVVYVVSRRRLECSINRALESLMGARVVLPHLGSSDCSCKSHLIRVGTSATVDRILRALRDVYSRYGRLLQVVVSPNSRWDGLLPSASGTRPEKS